MPEPHATIRKLRATVGTAAARARVRCVPLQNARNALASGSICTTAPVCAFVYSYTPVRRWHAACTLRFANEEGIMPDPVTLKRAARDRRQGKSASTQAGEFVREEMDHIRAGKHGARSAKQAIAIGLSKARRAGVDLPAPKSNASAATKRKAQQDRAAAKHPHTPSRKRSRATEHALEREGSNAASHRALSRQAHSAARKRSASDRSAAARKAVRTKGAAGRSAAARKGAQTRARRRRTA
jgi:hypothetical protein